MKNIRVQDVAAMLGVNPQTVRVMMQQGLCPFGTAFKKEGSKHWTYVLFPEMVHRYCGKVEHEN